MDAKKQLIRKCVPFLDEVKDMTAGTEVERWLNAAYGPDSAFYRDMARLVKAGVEEGWAANIEIAGPHYRRSRLCEPSVETHYFSITAVYMDSDKRPPEETFRGDYHMHPYGEINMVIPLNSGAMLAGPNGWCGAGWTAPAPGSHHYPEVKGGALIAFFFLPAGRISYDIKPPASLPVPA